MKRKPRPHLLAVDDGPFQKGSSLDTPLVAVLMEGHDLVEGVAVNRFPIDGDAATDFLSDWLLRLRFHASAQGIVLGGITLAGLAVVDVPDLARRTRLPVIVVNRRDPSAHRLRTALCAAGLENRIPLVERAPPAVQTERGIYVACAGLESEQAAALVETSCRKADLPEPLRIAHLIAGAIARGESRGRV